MVLLRQSFQEEKEGKIMNLKEALPEEGGHRRILSAADTALQEQQKEGKII